MDNTQIEERLKLIETTIAQIHERNYRVEYQKAWETSRTRLLSITTVTYVTMVLVFAVLSSPRPLLDALVPTTGFFLSTLSLPFIRRIWDKKFLNRS